MASQRHLQGGGIKFVLVVLLLGAALAAGWLWQRAQAFGSLPLQIAEAPRVLLIDKGDGFNAVLAKLRAQGVRQGSDLEWKLLARSMKVAGSLQVGEYEIPGGITPRDLLTNLASGRVLQRRFTIVPGWNFRELRAALLADERLEHPLAVMSETELLKRLERSEASAEGRFLPQTYMFIRGSSDLEILERAADALDKTLAEAWQDRDPEVPLASPEELLILASIIEKETGLASERPQIAGVFARRLKIGMRLQTDPTVIYGMGSRYAGNIRRSDLETDTPYNTYTRAGLPPTPIAMAGKAAIDAAAHPAEGDAIYFVARGNGAHYFSATLAEHAAAVRKYQLNQ